MRRTRLVRYGTAAAAVALLVAGCGSSSSGGNNNNAGPKPKPAENVFNAGTTGIRNASDHKGGTLNFVADGDCDYWDPARTYYGFCWDMQRLFSRGLMAYSAAPGDAGLNTVPDLATAAGESPNGKDWTYHLKSGIKFEDGSPVTSKNIKYGIERVFAQSVINGGPTYVITFLCPGPINASGGCDAYKGPYGTDKDPNHLGLSTIDTPDDNTIVFHLNKVVGDWNYIMALPASTPVPISYDQSPKGGAHYTDHPYSTGPYKFATYTAGKSLTLVRNTMWNSGNDPFRKALPDKIVFTVNANDDDIDQRILNDIADVNISGTGVQPTAQAKILSNPSLKSRADNPVTGATRYLAIESKVAPFDNVHCRRAVQYAVSKVDWQTARGGPIGGGAIGTSMLNPTIKGYTQFDAYPDNNGDGDIAKAKDELKQCGKPNGFTTHLASQNNGKGTRVATAVQASLKRAGINVIIDLGNAATYYSQFIGAPAVNRAKGRGLMVAGWGADWPTGYGFFSSLIDGRKILPQGNSNYSETKDDTIDTMIDQAVATTDPNKAGEIWGQIDKRLMTEDATLVPMTWDKALVINSKAVTNAYILSSLLGIYDFQAMGHV
ncbi:MAG: peptide/nickel transport system substrate-binding protein [Frankiaceae bacterium]|jgi:peptide/nickel transport system substrate-binding protein|nr:peptide/nickel transport system substrate-binding protein [Frankiaceae bacterium]